MAHATQPAIQCSRPEGSIATLVDDVDAAGRKSIGAGKCFSAQRTIAQQQSRQTTALPTGPYFLRSAGDGVHNISAKRARSGVGVILANPRQPAVGRSVPGPAGAVCKDRAVVLRRIVSPQRIGKKKAVPIALYAAGASDPQIAFAIFEESVHRTWPSVYGLFHGYRAVWIDSRQTATG